LTIPLSRFAATLINHPETIVRCPEYLDPGQPLHDAMHTLWERSVHEMDRGRVREHGATIALDGQGALSLVNIVIGSEQAVTPNFEVARDLTVVGFFHTHPTLNRAARGSAFSDVDIAGAINDLEQISIVQSDIYLFALVRTRGTPQQANSQEVWQIFDRAYQDGLQDGLSPAKAVFNANLELCARYRFAFYRGRAFGRLQEVYQP